MSLSILVLKQISYAGPGTMSLDHDLLQGKWQQDCAQKALRSEIFLGSVVRLEEAFFTDENCQTPLLTFINEGNFVLPVPGQMDFQFTSVRIVLWDDAVVRNYLRRQVCGISDWQKGVEKEISGRSCEIFTIGLPHRVPTAGDMRYGIYHLEDDRLMFGKLTRDQNAMSPEKRPTQLDPRFYRKVITMDKSSSGL